MIPIVLLITPASAEIYGAASSPTMRLGSGYDISRPAAALPSPFMDVTPKAVDTNPHSPTISAYLEESTSLIKDLNKKLFDLGLEARYQLASGSLHTTLEDVTTNTSSSISFSLAIIADFGREDVTNREYSLAARQLLHKSKTLFFEKYGREAVVGQRRGAALIATFNVHSMSSERSRSFIASLKAKVSGVGWSVSTEGSLQTLITEAMQTGHVSISVQAIGGPDLSDAKARKIFQDYNDFAKWQLALDSWIANVTYKNSKPTQYLTSPYPDPRELDPMQHMVDIAYERLENLEKTKSRLQFIIDNHQMLYSWIPDSDYSAYLNLKRTCDEHISQTHIFGKAVLNAVRTQHMPKNLTLPNDVLVQWWPDVVLSARQQTKESGIWDLTRINPDKVVVYYKGYFGTENEYKVADVQKRIPGGGRYPYYAGQAREDNGIWIKVQDLHGNEIFSTKMIRG